MCVGHLRAFSPWILMMMKHISARGAKDSVTRHLGNRIIPLTPAELLVSDHREWLSVSLSSIIETPQPHDLSHIQTPRVLLQIHNRRTSANTVCRFQHKTQLGSS